MTGQIAEVFGELAQRSPETKVGLVVEGGGMRGAASMSYLSVLHRHGMTPSFDFVFAESSGAVNSAYFAAGQAEIGLEVYRRAVRLPKLVRSWRIGNAVDLDAAFDRITRGELALDCDRLRNSRIQVRVSLTDAERGLPEVLLLGGSDERIGAILKASSAIVPYYNRPVIVDGHGFVDGGIADPLPIMRAIETGCSHILVLLTRSACYQPRKLRLWERLATRALLAKWGREFRNVYHQLRPERYYRSRRIALADEAPDRAVQIATIAPPADLGRIERFFFDAGRLEEIVETCSRQLESGIKSVC